MSKPDINNQRNRLPYLDMLRILAIFLVVYNHTGSNGFTLFAYSTDSPFYFLYMMFSVFCKIAVPIFFMISGALLLPKQEPLKKLFSKRILRTAIVLLIVSVPYYFWLHRAEGIGISNFLSYIYGNSASTSLWYLYSYIGLLLLLPFLRSMVKSMQAKDFVYLIIGHIILVGVLPCLEYCLWKGNITLNESFSSVIFMTQNIFFALLGYYLEHIFDNTKYTQNAVWSSILLSLAAILVTCLMTYYQTKISGECDVEQLQRFFNCFICIPAITVYLLMKRIFASLKGEKIRKILSVFGSAVFGVYLIEKISRSLTGQVYTLLCPFVGSFIASLIWCLAVCCVSFILIISLKNIPVVKKLVNKFI